MENVTIEGENVMQQPIQQVQYSNLEHDVQSGAPGECGYITENVQQVSTENQMREEQFHPVPMQDHQSVAMDQRPIYSNDGMTNEMNSQPIHHNDPNAAQNLISPSDVVLQPGKKTTRIHVESYK